MAYGYPCSGCIIQQLVEDRSHTSNDSPTWGGEGAEQREIQVVLCKEIKTKNKTGKSAEYSGSLGSSEDRGQRRENTGE